MADPLQHAPRVAPVTTAEITDEMWLEIARHNPGHNPGAQPHRQTLAAMPATAVQPGPLPAAPQAGPLPLPALLALDGAAFIDAAYQTILDRAPDDVGIAHLMRELAAGTSKIVILGRLQASGEGRETARRTGRSVRGLRRRYLAQRLYRIPVLGRLARLAGAVLRRAGVSRLLGAGRRHAFEQQAAMLGMLAAAQEAMQRRAAAQEAALAALEGRPPPPLPLPSPENFAMTAALAGQARSLANVTAQIRDTVRRLSDLEISGIDSLLAITDTLEDQGRRLAQLEATLSAEAVAALIEARAAAFRQTLDDRLCRAEAVVAKNRQDVIDQERRIGLMLEALRRRSEAAAPLPEILQAPDEGLDSLYVDFEDRFRGSRADIKERQRFYLPILHESQAGTPERPVVDVGCGRGEFLELLRDEGLVGRGVDANTAMAAACRERGLECAAGDAVAYLRQLAPGSLGAVTGFHIIEHLPFNIMVRLFDAALDALAEGGVMVFETPNPANLLVASRWFYLDPTHRNPLPGEMVAMIAEARGFCRVSIVNLHPMDQHFGGNDPVLREQLDGLFYGPQDYALLARKP
jgi:SAM-dependent methyltransferase